MKGQFGPEEKALFRAAGEVLHYVWDPIGVAGVPQARDEYDGYVAQVCELLWRGADAEEVSRHLVQLANENMGLSGTEALADLAAKRLVQWKEVVTR